MLTGISLQPKHPSPVSRSGSNTGRRSGRAFHLIQIPNKKRCRITNITLPVNFVTASAILFPVLFDSSSFLRSDTSAWIFISTICDMHEPLSLSSIHPSIPMERIMNHIISAQHHNMHAPRCSYQLLSRRIMMCWHLNCICPLQVAEPIKESELFIGASFERPS
jgi:hypothetical protein